MNNLNQKIVSVSMLTLLSHIPVMHHNDWTHEDDPIVFVSLHTRKGEQLLQFHTASGDIVFGFLPNNKRQLNAYITSITLEEANRLGIEYKVNPQYPETTLDAKFECEDTSIATDKPIGIRPAPRKKEKRTEKYIQPFPVGSSLHQITRGKNAGKWKVSGLEGVQNSLKRFANIPFYVVKWTHNAVTVANPEGITYTSLRPFTTKEEAEEWASDMKKEEIEISEWILTADQIVK